MTNQVVRAHGFDPKTTENAMVLARGPPVPLDGPGGLALRVTENYSFSEGATTRDRWQIALTGYWYTVERSTTEEELLAFHWHPQVEDLTFPHLHLGRAILADRAFSTAHVPTGHVALDAVLRLLIRDLDVRPLRADWRSILHGT